MVRTVEPGVDGRAAAGELGGEVRVHVADERLAEQPARDAGLVGDHDEGEAGPAQQAERVGRPRVEGHLIEAIEVADVVDERAIPIEEDCWCHRCLATASTTSAASIRRRHR